MAFGDNVGIVFQIRAEARQAHGELSRTQELVLKNEAAILRFQRTLDRAQSGPRGDFGAKSAREASRAYGELGSQISALSGGRLGFAGGGALGVTAGLAGGFLAAAKAGVEYRETLDRLSKSFTTLLGSQQAAAAHLAELQQFAARTPFEFDDVARASQRFQNMGLAARDVIPLLQSVGNAVAAAGGGSEQINRVSLAISQMSAKGKVSAEEMNQLAESGVGGWRILEEQLGKTKAELFEMAKAGEISADTFIAAFRKAYEGGDAMKKQMETLTGATSTLKDNVKLLLASAFDPLHAGLKAIAVEAARASSEGFSLARAYDAAATAAVNFMKLNPSAATTWHVLGMNTVQPGMTFQGRALLGANNAASAGIEAAQRAEQEEFGRQFTEQAKKLNDELLRAVQVGGPAADMIRKLKAELRTAGDDSTLGKVTEQFRQWREGFENMGSLAPEGWRGMLDAAEKEAAAQARLVDERIKQLKAQKEAEEEVKRTREAALDGLRKAMIDVQNFGKLEGEAAVNTMKWAAGIRDLTEKTKQLPLADIIAATGMLRGQLAAKQAGETFDKQLAALTKEFGGQESAVSRVNTTVAEYLKLVTELTGKVGALTEAQAALAEQARSYGAFEDLMSQGQQFKGFGISDIKPGAVPAGPGAGPIPDVDAQASAWQSFKEAAIGSMGEVQDFATGFGGAVNDVFKQMAGAMGQAAAAAMVYSQSIGKAVQAALTAAMASLAAEAFVQAIVNTAKGFAALAGFLPGSAALYFKAAAFWGAAGVAAGAAGAMVGGIGGGGAPGGAVASATGGAQDYNGGRPAERETIREGRYGGAPDPNRAYGQPVEIRVPVIIDGDKLDEIVARTLLKPSRSRDAVLYNTGQLVG